jgi:type IX secretion system PorP/SprF family membrane protein
MRIIIIILAIISVSGVSLGQQNPMVSQYLFNQFIINPAYAGSQRPLSTAVQYRRQWWGFDGAPKTGFLAIDGMLGNRKNALGLLLAHDQIGVTTEADLQLSYAYHLELAHGHKLSFGLRGGVGHYTARLRDVTIWDPDDPIYMNNITSKLYPKAGFGVFYYTENYFLGASIPTLLAYNPDRRFNVDIGRETFYRRHYFASTGFLAKINDDLILRPAVLLKYLPEAPMQADINISLLMADAIMAGLSYRTGESIVALAEYQFENGLRIGYSYDFNINKIATFSHGTHEMVLGWDLIRTDRKLRPF